MLGYARKPYKLETIPRKYRLKVQIYLVLDLDLTKQL